jgi:diguanylate cyclase (GGDEF)-like protein
LADIDFFKKVNDTYGHQVGDEVLRKVAKALDENLRNIDCIGRYGGEEFMMVLPQTTLDGALIKAERVRQQIEKISFPNVGEEFFVTLSMGVAEHKLDEDVENTVQRADMALYKAKNNGRNQTVSDANII